MSACPLDDETPVVKDPDPHDWGFETALSVVDSFDNATSASGKLGGVTGVLAGGTHV